MTARFDWSQPKSTVPLSPLQAGLTRAIATLTHELEQTQWLKTADLEALQYKQLQVTAGYFEQKSPAFRARLAEAGLSAADLTTPEALRRLPLLHRRALREPFGVPDAALPPGHTPSEMLSTSGSTGEPVVVRRTAVNTLFWHALTMRELFWHQTPFAQRFTAIRATNPEHVDLPNWGIPVSLMFATGPAQLIPITADIAQQVAWLRAFRPNALLVYPNVLDAIARLCREQKIVLPDLKVIRSIGETLSPQIREAAQETFGCKVVDNYSSQEVGVIALQCPQSDLYHVMDEALIVEVIGDDGHACGPGEIGRAIVTDLRNAATPLFRYDIGDYVEAGEPCPCGRGLHTLKRIAGRERNLIAMPDGTRHWPLVGFMKFRSAAPVLQYQFIQESLTTIEVRLVLERSMTSSEDAALRAVIQDALGYPFEVRFALYEDALPRGANGKFEEFVCRIQS